MRLPYWAAWRQLDYCLQLLAGLWRRWGEGAFRGYVWNELLQSWNIWSTRNLGYVSHVVGDFSLKSLATLRGQMGADDRRPSGAVAGARVTSAAAAATLCLLTGW